MTRDGIRSQLAESLDRLGTDRVDFYWLHRDAPAVPVADILGWLNELVAEGRFAAFGCSNWEVPRIREAMECARRSGVRGFSASQISWSLARADLAVAGGKGQVFMDDATFAFHQSSALPVVAYSSQAGGFFAGNYDPEGPSAGGQPNPNIVRYYGTKANYARLAAAKRLAAAQGCTPNQISLACLLNQSFQSFAIVGANTPERVVDSCGAADIVLSDAERRSLEGSEERPEADRGA
jgi:aryl-alcohol dehydrogenase-like predicted oxidoreductase